MDENETERTYQDIKIRGQWNCGIITDDGYIIDGNRRLSIISKLYDDTGSDTWKYMDVARLEEPISAEDLWKIEAGIQLGKDEIVRYGPINELLKLREGKNAGLSLKEIVRTLYGFDSEKEVEDRLDRLALIEQFLVYIGKPEKYSEAKNKVEHFINLQSIIEECKKREYNPDLISQIKKVTFQLIKEGVPHLEIRKIRQMIEKNLVDAISEISDAAKDLKPTKSSEVKSEDLIDNEVKDIVNEFREEEREISVTEAHFINAKDILDVDLNQGKETLLLSRAEKNLRPLLDYQGNELSTSSAIESINKIFRYAEELKKKYSK